MEEVSVVEVIENNLEVQSNKAEWTAPKLVVMNVGGTLGGLTGNVDGTGGFAAS